MHLVIWATKETIPKRVNSYSRLRNELNASLVEGWQFFQARIRDCYLFRPFSLSPALCGETLSNKLLTKWGSSKLKNFILRERSKMDCDKDKSADNDTEKKEACASCELSQETKELCGQIGRFLARIGDTLNSQLRLTRNGQNLRLNCRDRERLNDDETRLRTGINKLP